MNAREQLTSGDISVTNWKDILLNIEVYYPLTNEVKLSQK